MGISALVLGLLLVVAVTRAPGKGAIERARFVFTGLPAKGEVAYTLSILSFASFWPPDEWSAFRNGMNRGLGAEVAGASALELTRIARGIFENGDTRTTSTSSSS